MWRRMAPVRRSAIRSNSPRSLRRSTKPAPRPTTPSPFPSARSSPPSATWNPRPSLHADRLNPNVDFTDSPFRVQREAAAWAPRGDEPAPRVAGVSSFGAGGANAHVVLADHPHPQHGNQPDEPQVIVLSAKSADRLAALAQSL